MKRSIIFKTLIDMIVLAIIAVLSTLLPLPWLHGGNIVIVGSHWAFIQFLLCAIVNFVFVGMASSHFPTNNQRTSYQNVIGLHVYKTTYYLMQTIMYVYVLSSDNAQLCWPHSELVDMRLYKELAYNASQFRAITTGTPLLITIILRKISAFRKTRKLLIWV